MIRDWNQGTIYLIHFDRPYKHAGHYLGYASDLEKRLERHRKGRGSRLLDVIQKEGIDWEVVRTWSPAGPVVEAELKRYHNNRLLSPICRHQALSERAEHLRTMRKERK
jgi:predicted GIY-YIG superfamily endonuclease